MKLLLVWMLVLVVGLELGLRSLNHSSFWAFSRFPDPYRGTGSMPGADAWQRSEGLARIRINSFGFRDREWQEKQPGVYRVAVLGDSFTEALQVPLPQTWWRQLEQRLNACSYGDKSVEVMNFATSGHSTAQALQTLRHHVARHQPDEVVLAFFPGNDVVENHRDLNADPIRPYLVAETGLDPGQWEMDFSFREHRFYRPSDSWLTTLRYRLLLRSVLVQQLVLLWDMWRQRQILQLANPQWLWEPGIDARVYVPPEHQRQGQSGRLWSEAWAISGELMRRMHRLSTAMGAPFRLLALGTGSQVHPQPQVGERIAGQLGVADLFYPQWRLRQLAEADAYAYLDLARPMALQAQASGDYYHGFGTRRGSGHWNRKGHHLAAQLIASELCGADKRP